MRVIKKIQAWLLIALSAVIPLPVQAASEAASVPFAVSASLRLKARQTLSEKLEKGQGWLKVHAAESLLSLDYRQGIAQIFGRELALKGGEPKYRIGIWRVLAQASGNDQQRQQWIEKIRDAFLDSASPDRLHAAETLAKLGYKVHGPEVGAFERAARESRGSLAVDVRWILANNGRVKDETRLAALLQSDDRETRGAAAYAIRYLQKLTAENWDRLAAAACQEPTNSEARVFLVSAAFIHAPAEQKAYFKAGLLRYAESGKPDEKFEVCAALAKAGQLEDLPLLSGLLDEKDPDVRVGAAQALLLIDRRVTP